MITSNKLSIGIAEVKTVHESRQVQALKTKKPEQMLLDLRSKKIAEMNAYKEKESDRKVTDIQNLLKMMDAHGKLPKRSTNLEGENKTAN